MPGQILVINESMIPFSRMFQFRQYIKNKSHKYGVKLFKMRSADYYRYVIVYTDKGDKVTVQGHIETVVHEFLKSVEHKEGHHRFADNFYSSISLGKQLFEKRNTERI